MSDPEPFRASAQYVSKQGQSDAVVIAEQDENTEGDDDDAAMEEQCCDGNDEDCEICNVANKKKKKKTCGKPGKAKKPACKSKQNKKVAAEASKQVVPSCQHAKDGKYKPHDYCCARDAYIKKVKLYLKASHRVASSMWKTSSECRTLLATVSLPELKRRRFVDKGATVHPYRTDG